MTNRILLADDSITIQKVVNLTFADEGIEVVSVSNGEAAERQLSEINPDLVLADIFMPGKNGYELCEYIKESADFHHVPVILLVGAFEPFDQSEARRVRADAHLTKPFETRTLVETVRNLIGSGNKTDAQSVESPSNNHVEEAAVNPPAPMPSSSFNIDLSAMSDQWTPDESAPQHIAEAAAPQDENFSSEASPFDAVPSSDEFDPAGFTSTDEDMGRTIELSSLSAEEQPQPDSMFSDTLNLDISHQSAVADVETPIDLGEESINAEFESDEVIPTWEATEAAPQEFDQSAPDLLLDFDKVEGQDSPDSDNVLGFDVDFSSPTQEAPAADDSIIDIDVEEADSPVTAEPLWQAEDSNPLTDQQRPAMQEAVSLRDPDLVPPPASVSSLFSQDDPLGDLLEVDKAEEQLLSESRERSDSEPPLAGELTFEPVTSQEASPLQIEEPASDEEFVIESPAVETDFSMDEPFGDISSDQPDEPFETQEMASPEMPSFTSSDPLDVGSDFDIAGMDGGDVVEDQMTGDVEASGFDFQVVGGESEATQVAFDESDSSGAAVDDEEVIASAAWTEEEAHFRPIDIEAVPVEGEEPLGELATGFEMSAAEPSAAEASGTDWQAVELPQAVVDEIVRRVVSQISEEVVREIAWEVVPDCVERVIEKLTREEIAKNM